MYEAEKKIFRTINIAVDALLVLAAFAITQLIRRLIVETGILKIKPIGSPEVVSLLILAMAFFYLLLLYYNRFYPTVRIRKFRFKVYILFKVILQLAVIIISVSFILNLNINRTLIVFSCPILFSLAMLKEYIVSNIALSRQKRGKFKSTLVIGSEGRVKSILKKIQEEDLSLVITKKFHTVQIGREIKLHIKTDEIIDILNREPIELVIIAGFQGSEGEIKELLIICEERGIEVWLENPMLIRKSSKTSFGYLANIPMIIFSSVPGYNWRMFAKTLFDYAASLIILPFYLIAYAIIGIGIKLSSPGPILFTQERGGLYGKTFVFYKFRTMIEGAEQKKEELRKFNIMRGPVFKLKDDPRVFPFGRYLRRFSLDELPQIINVLKGEMSMVGPRPLPIPEVKKIKGADRRRLSMKPGITCLWQISGRSDIADFNKWVKLDLEYIDNWSFLLDMKIFFKTIFVVLFKRKGAY
ncbi:MAG: sugar transferase [Candidatus Omnitrophica bacterium]|nr:sugar transferase [Candidatus Omnitrophota bacterium]